MNGRTVGVLQINYRLSTWDVATYAVIEDFYLVAEARGQGVGTRMLDYACARAEGRGGQFIQVAVRPGDVSARRLYEAFGFTITPQSLWRSDLPLGCEVAFDEPAASDTETRTEALAINVQSTPARRAGAARRPNRAACQCRCSMRCSR